MINTEEQNSDSDQKNPIGLWQSLINKIPRWIKVLVVSLIMLSGSTFFIFVMFFNHGTLAVSAQTLPFDLFIKDLKQISCQQNPCQLELAPGNYHLSIIKKDYLTEERDITITLNQITNLSFQLNPIPTLQPYGQRILPELPNLPSDFSVSAQNLSLTLPSTFWTILSTQLANLKNLTSIQFAPDGSFFLASNGQSIYQQKISIDQKESQVISQSNSHNFIITADNQILLIDDLNNQTPALQLIQDQSSSAEILATFIRNFQQSKILPTPNLTSQQGKIAILEKQENQSSIYLVNLQQKTRELILNSNNTDPANPPIQDFAWIAQENRDNLLIQRNIADQTLPQISLYNTTDLTENILPINTELSRLTITPNGEIIYPQSSSTSLIDQTPTNFQIIKFNLGTQESQNLISIESQPLPTKLELDLKNKQLLLLIGQTIYSLNLSL